MEKFKKTIDSLWDQVHSIIIKEGSLILDTDWTYNYKTPIGNTKKIANTLPQFELMADDVTEAINYLISYDISMAGSYNLCKTTFTSNMIKYSFIITVIKRLRVNAADYTKEGTNNLFTWYNPALLRVAYELFGAKSIFFQQFYYRNFNNLVDGELDRYIDFVDGDIKSMHVNYFDGVLTLDKEFEQNPKIALTKDFMNRLKLKRKELFNDDVDVSMIITLYTSQKINSLLENLN